MPRSKQTAFLAGILLALGVSACGGTLCEEACDSFVSCQNSGAGLYTDDAAREDAVDSCVTSCEKGKTSDGKALSEDRKQCYADAEGSCSKINGDPDDVSGGCQGL